MKTLTVFVSKGTKDYYNAWVDELPGVYAVGASVEEAKANLLNSLTLYIQKNPARAWLREGNFRIEYVP